jgi:tetratricopeptide (TPR) repeat protein
MRPFVSGIAAGVLVVIAALLSANAAETAAEPPVACAALTVATPERLIESCTALIDSPATPDGDRLDAMITRAVALHNKGETDTALAEIDAVIAKDPARARAFRARGEIFRQTGQVDRAFEALNEAIRLDPGNADYDRAIADYDEAIKLRPEAKFLTNRGDAYQAKKDYDRAIADYDSALRLDPKYQRAWNNRGAAYRGKGDRVRALQDYATAIRLDPGDKAGALNHKEIALEVERLGALMYQKNLPSFNCATAKRAVQKAICADPGLARLDRDINGVFLRVIAESPNRRAALALTGEQRDFIAKRNASFGKRGYDLRLAMEARLKALTGVDGY